MHFPRQGLRLAYLPGRFITDISASGVSGRCPLIHTVFDRLPPLPVVSSESSSISGPIRVGFLLNSFTYGGSETETIELIYGSDPRILHFTGIAVKTCLPLPDGEPPGDGSFPPIYVVAEAPWSPADRRIRAVRDFQEAALNVIEASDIIITWGLANLQDYLPDRPLPKIVVCSKDSGEWAKSWLRANSLVTRHLVGNSTAAATAFPEPLHRDVRVIHDGVNPRRVAPRIGRSEQRRLWGLGTGDKVAGYLGRIEADKGVSKLVEGIARLSGEWKAVFIGVNPNSRYAGQLAYHCEEAIPGRYRLVPWTHDVGSALASLDVFCQTSDHEGFSNSLAEAWLAGIPTVYTNDTGAIPDLGELVSNDLTFETSCTDFSFMRAPE
jgi:glycosyltransferase involved in cell wall biosynthesis